MSRASRRRIAATAVLALCLSAATPAQGRLHEIPVQGRVDSFSATDVDGDGKLDLVITHHEGPRRFASWLRFDGESFPLRAVTVPPQATLAVVCDLLPAAGPEIVFVERDRLEVRQLRDPGASPRTLAEQPYFFDLPGRRLPLADLAADLGGDGRDDLVLPTPEGYSIIDSSDPENPRGLAGRVRQWVGQDYASDHLLDVTWTLPQLALADLDGDGRREMTYFLDRVLGIYSRGAGAGYELTLQDAAQLGEATESGRDASLSRRRMVLADIDADGRADILTSTNSGRITQLGSWGTRVAAHLAGAGGELAQKPDSVVKVKGISIPPRLFDVDGDRDLDLILSTIRTDLATGISAATLRKITVTYEVYPWEKGSGFARRPLVQRDIDVAFKDYGSEDGVVPFAYLHGDYDGDGKRDLLALGDGEFLIHRGGVSGGGFFSKSDGFDPQPTWKVAAPVTNNVEIVDLDGDGRSEVIFLGRGQIVIWRAEGLR